MEQLSKRPSKIQIIFEKYPFFKCFDFSAISGDESFVHDCIFLNEENKEYWDIEEDIVDYINDFIDTDTFATTKFYTKKLEQFYDKYIPKQKKFKKLFADNFKNLDNAYVYYFILSKNLIDLGFNPDLVFNYLEKELVKIKTSSQNGNDFAFSHMDRKNVSLFIHKEFIKLVKDNVHENKALKLAFNYFSDFYFYIDCCNLFLTVKTEEPKFDWKEFFKNNFDENFDRLHNNLSLDLEYKQIESGVANYSLKQREDFIKMQDATIVVNGETLVVDIPRFRLDLVEYSKKFGNCIGRVESYAENCVTQKNSIIGLFSTTGKPRYCIYTEKYSFTEAKGVDNAVIPKEVFNALQKLLTLKPEIPSDFIPMEDHFIQGYKYNPEKRSLFILFILNPDVIYEYLEISNEIYEEFSQASSKGAYLNKVIKKCDYDKIILE